MDRVKAQSGTALVDPHLERLEPHALASDEKRQNMRKPYMQVALSRHQQESHQAVVRHEDLRKPHEGAKIPIAAKVTHDRGLAIELSASSCYRQLNSTASAVTLSSP